MKLLHISLQLLRELNYRFTPKSCTIPCPEKLISHGKEIFSNLGFPLPKKVNQLKFMRIFGQRTLNPVLWYVNRKSISHAVFIGTFWGILPVPFHSVFIVLTVLLIEVNLPLSLTLAWLSNPLTVVPILYLGFLAGQ